MLLTSATLNELKRTISTQLDRLIDGEVVLTDLPYHKNLGDILIWEGELDYLKQRKINCLSQTSFSTFKFPKLSPDVTILLHGGGNFGDLYRVCQNFRLRVIQTYPNNKIVMLPQSLYYKDATLLKKDAEIMKKHKRLYLCARDELSYKIMEKYFSNNILLVPDMAFCIDVLKLKKLAESDYLSKNRTALQQNSLRGWIKRKDDEYLPENEPIEENLLISDWPTFERFDLTFWMLEKLLGLHRRLNLGVFQQGLASLIDYYAVNYVRSYGVKLGCQFINKFSGIISSRLHGMILALLLEKPVEYQDNISNKLSSFYKTWLQGSSRLSH